MKRVQDEYKNLLQKESSTEKWIAFLRRMHSFLLKINCILPISKTKKSSLSMYFRQHVLSFKSWSILLKSKDNTVVLKQQ